MKHNFARMGDFCRLHCRESLLNLFFNCIYRINSILLSIIRDSRVWCHANPAFCSTLQIRPRCAGALGAPLNLRSYWKHEALRSDFRLDYAYNRSAALSVQRLVLSNVSIQVPVSGDVTKMLCKPPGSWLVCLWIFIHHLALFIHPDS